METTDQAASAVTDHLLAARRALKPLAAQTRTLARCDSPRARQEAEQAQRHLDRVRSRIAALVDTVAALEATLNAGQDWHDRYEQVQRM